MRLLGGAWTAHVIWYLREGERCFTELQLDIGKVSPKMLSSCLRKLEQEGIISRWTKKTTSPPTVCYGLTPVGQELCDAVVNVIDVAQRVKRAGESGDRVIGRSRVIGKAKLTADYVDDTDLR